MNTWMIWTLVLATTVMLAGCRKEINGSGNYTTTTRLVGNFDKVTSCGDFVVILVSDPVSRIVLHGEDNILPEVETVVEGNNLKIYYDNDHYNYDHHGITVTVYSPDFKSIDLQGSGKISATDTMHSNLKVNVSGSGKIDLLINNNFTESNISGSGTIVMNGVALTASHTISGSGKLQAFTLISNNVSATISGSGSCKVYALNYLDATISGSGDVIYLGNPQITTHISGSGQVKPG